VHRQVGTNRTLSLLNLLVPFPLSSRIYPFDRLHLSLQLQLPDLLLSNTVDTVHGILDDLQFPTSENPSKSFPERTTSPRVFTLPFPLSHYQLLTDRFLLLPPLPDHLYLLHQHPSRLGRVTLDKFSKHSRSEEGLKMKNHFRRSKPDNLP